MARPEPLNPLDLETLPKLAPLGALTHERKDKVEPDRNISDCDAEWVISFALDINKVFALAYAVDERIAVVDQLTTRQAKELRNLQVWANQALPGLTEDGPALENQVDRLQQDVNTLWQQVKEFDSKQTDIKQKVDGLHSWREEASLRLPKNGPELEKCADELGQRVEVLWHAYEKKSGPFEQSTTASIHLDSVSPRDGIPVWAWVLIFFIGVLQVVTLLIALKR